MHIQQPQHARFIAAHLATKTDDIGEHDRRQPSLLRRSRAVGRFLHGGGLFCWRCLAVNCGLYAGVVVTPSFYRH